MCLVLDGRRNHPDAPPLPLTVTATRVEERREISAHDPCVETYYANRNEHPPETCLKHKTAKKHTKRKDRPT